MRCFIYKPLIIIRTREIAKQPRFLSWDRIRVFEEPVFCDTCNETMFIKTNDPRCDKKMSRRGSKGRGRVFWQYFERTSAIRLLIHSLETRCFRRVRCSFHQWFSFRKHLANTFFAASEKHFANLKFSIFLSVSFLLYRWIRVYSHELYFPFSQNVPYVFFKIFNEYTFQNFSS